jgi:leucyl-tRNA synthetase
MPPLKKKKKKKKKKKNIEFYFDSPFEDLAYQGHSPQWGEVKCLATFKGKDLIGTAVKAPLTPYAKIYVLPMFTINIDKTTGIVTSVPSDSPDDYVALRDIKQKENLRKVYGITEEMVRRIHFHT